MNMILDCFQNKEVWLPIPGYDGKYEVSNMGSVRSVDRVVSYKNGKKLLKKGMVLSPTACGRGYYVVSLYNGHRMYNITIHRLVAEAFIPNPNGYTVVNHKDENKLNNCVENLEWCTQRYNANYGTSEEKRSKGYFHPKTPVEQRGLDGTLIREYKSIGEAQRETGVRGGHICWCCKNIHKTAGGYKWNYKHVDE